MPKARGPAPQGPSHELRSAEVVVGAERLIVISYPTEEDDTALSPAEQSVVELVCRGLRNAEIARMRGTKPRTIANQLAAIYRKLGITSRVELAASRARRTCSSQARIW
jgi:DNA-binding NarL/FixJ family response regulator